MSHYDFLIRAIPPSINGAYGGNTKRYLVPKARKFKKLLEQAIYSDPKSYFASKSLNGKRLEFDMYVSCPNWFTKDGQVKKNDVSNRIKIFEDAVMEALGLDDSYVWTLRVHKISSIFDVTYCEIQDIPEGHTTLLPDRLSHELHLMSQEAKAQAEATEK